MTDAMSSRRQHEQEMARQREARLDRDSHHHTRLAGIDRQREAVKLVQDAARRRFGKSIDAEGLRHVGKLAAERFERRPELIDRTFAAEAQRLREVGRDQAQQPGRQTIPHLLQEHAQQRANHDRERTR